MGSKIRFALIIVFAFLCSALPVYAADLTVSVNASSYIRAIPETMYGTNTQCWDGMQNGGNDNFNNLMDANDWNINWINFSKLGGGSNKALREWWTGVSGGTVSNLTSNVNYPYNPTNRELGHSLEGPTNWTNSSGSNLDNYGTRIRGYLNPITTGSYTFWIASDDAGEL